VPKIIINLKETQNSWIVTLLKNLSQLQITIYTCHVEQFNVWQQHDYSYQATLRLHGSDRLIPTIKSLMSNDLYPATSSSSKWAFAACHGSRISLEKERCPLFQKEVFILIKGNWLSGFLTGSIQKYDLPEWHYATRHASIDRFFKSSVPLSFRSAVDIIELCVLSNDTRRLCTKAAVKRVSRDRIATKIHDVPRYIVARDTRLPAQLRYYLAVIKLTVTFVGSYFLRLSSLDNTVFRRGDPIRGEHATKAYVRIYIVRIHRIIPLKTAKLW